MAVSAEKPKREGCAIGISGFGELNAARYAQVVREKPPFATIEGG